MRCKIYHLISKKSRFYFQIKKFRKRHVCWNPIKKQFSVEIREKYLVKRFQRIFKVRLENGVNILPRKFYLVTKYLFLLWYPIPLMTRKIYLYFLFPCCIIR